MFPPNVYKKGFTFWPPMFIYNTKRFFRRAQASVKFLVLGFTFCKLAESAGKVDEKALWLTLVFFGQKKAAREYTVYYFPFLLYFFKKYISRKE